MPVINRLAKQFTNVVLTQDWHPPAHRSFASAHPGKKPFDTIVLPYGEQILWPDHCVQGTEGARLNWMNGYDEGTHIVIPREEAILRSHVAGR